ncbi:hypothetical protein KDE13_07465 [Campylobacter sp. faydin G-140]|uniref:hypothetical protein n=1 Tax=Campylobacter anatolicus TaxID=2829105 RepID=UPI001B99BDA3|nr:hypothetical protein [Campylobacter anatolicus]MBR8466175.1 hypothetical protein [Campylobacter anatolicus]
MATSIYELKLAQEKLEALQFLLTQVDELEIAINNFNSSGVKEFETDIKNAKEQIIATKDEIKLTKSEFDTALQKFNQDLASANAKVAELGDISTALKNNGIKTLLDEINQLIKTKSDGIINDNEISSVCVYSSSKITQLVKQVKDEISLTIQQIVSESQEASLNIALDTKLDKNANAVSASKLETPRSISGIEFDGTKDITLKKENIGLNEVDNTSDLNKPISKAVKTELDSLKQSVDEIKSQASKTYNGVRLFSHLSGIKYLFMYQEVIRDAKTHEILKYGDIIVNGRTEHSFYMPGQHARDRYAKPQRLALPYNEEIIDLVTQYNYTGAESFIAIPKGKNYIYVWGSNNRGELGVGHTQIVVIPTKVEFESEVVRVYMSTTQVNVHYKSTFVMLKNGDVYVCGANNDGELGIGTKVSPSTFVKNEFLSGKSIVKIWVTGTLNTYFQILKDNGKYDIYGCGYNNNGSIGSMGRQVLNPTLLASDVDWFYTAENGSARLGDSNYFNDSFCFIKNNRCYACGLIGKVLGKIVSNNHSTNTPMIVAKGDGTPFENVKQCIILSDNIAFLLENDGKLYICTAHESLGSLKGSDGNIVRHQNGFELYVSGVKKIELIHSYQLMWFTLLVYMDNGDLHLLSNIEGISNTSTVINPAVFGLNTIQAATENAKYLMKNFKYTKLDLPIAVDEIREIATAFSDYETLGSTLYFSDGLRIYKGAGRHADNISTTENSIGIEAIPLMITRR